MRQKILVKWLTFLCCNFLIMHSAFLGLSNEIERAAQKKNKMPFQFNAIFNGFDGENCSFFSRFVSFVCQMTAFFGPFYVLHVGMPQLLPSLTRYFIYERIWNFFSASKLLVDRAWISFDSILCNRHMYIVYVIQSMHRLTINLMNLESESCEFIFNSYVCSANTEIND